MPDFQPVLLANVGKPDSHTRRVYEQTGGYQALRKALGMQPKDVIEAVKASGLRGRGGAGCCRWLGFCSWRNFLSGLIGIRSPRCEGS